MVKDGIYRNLLLLCSHSRNDVPPVPQRNVSIAAERGAVRPSIAKVRKFSIVRHSCCEGSSAGCVRGKGVLP